MGKSCGLIFVDPKVIVMNSEVTTWSKLPAKVTKFDLLQKVHALILELFFGIVDLIKKNHFDINFKLIG